LNVLQEISVSIFDSHPDEIARFEALLGAADDREERTKAIEDAIRIAESLVEEHPDDADAHQCLGLAWYHFPGSSSWRSWHCRRALHRALQIDAGHQFARHFLACLLFDQEEYQDALEVLTGAEFDYFVERGQEWRALKNEELRIVCTLRTSPDAFPQGDFDSFTERFLDAQQREDRDVSLGSWVFPQELREHAEWMIATGVSRDDSRVRQLLDFCSRIGYSDSFWDPRLKPKNDGESGPRG
jgi:tetratricopeptide (TPR) repeat protein